MIDLTDLRARSDAYRDACRKKRIKFDIDAFLELDEKRRTSIAGSETLKSQLNALNKQIPQLAAEEKQAKLAELKELSGRSKALAQEVKEIEEEWKRQQLLIPSIPLDRVPEGKDDTENVEIKRWGDLPQFDFAPKSHLDLGTELDILDIERGVKIAGSRNYFLKGDGARLHHAVLNFAMDLITKRGYTLMEPPHIVRYSAMAGTGYFPGAEDMAYHLDERDAEFYLIGTSEVPVASYHSDEFMKLEELPRKYSGFSACYRREAGTYGKDTQGLYRVHQFYKVEQVIICEAEEKKSAEAHAELLKNSEEMLQQLQLPYRVVDVCAGDMGQGQVYKNDIETWMPSRKAYGETHSCSTLHDFQARRLNLKYRDAEGRTRFCHTLNNTLVASPRILIPILEINQQRDGSVVIPEVLRPYMGGQERIAKR